MAIHSFLCFPETAGKPLEEIGQMFAIGGSVWKIHGAFSTSRLMEKGELDTEKQVAATHEEIERTTATPVDSKAVT
jgi:hypothetical protein